MWDWLLKREAGRDRTALNAERPLSRYIQEILDAESSSVAIGLCASGHFNQHGALADERVLRRAVDYFLGSPGRTPEIDDTLTLNLALLGYLERVMGSAFVITAGWYELAGCTHGLDPAVSLAVAIDERILNAQCHFPMHVWLTSQSFEILDVTMGRLLGTGADGAGKAAVPFYFRAPSVDDLLTYHPIGIIDAQRLRRYGGYGRTERLPNEHSGKTSVENG